MDDHVSVEDLNKWAQCLHQGGWKTSASNATLTVYHYPISLSCILSWNEEENVTRMGKNLPLTIICHCEQV